MNRIMRTILGGAAVLAIAATGLASPASAADEATLTRQKTEITRRIDLRIHALKQFDFTLNHAKHITAEHKSTLHTLITGGIDGLTALKSKVAGETTREALRADAVSMVQDYRVFILVGPKVRLTIVGDSEAVAIERLQKAHDKLAELVGEAKDAGNDTAEAEQDLADMQAAIEKAKSDIDGKVVALLAIQPGPDGDGIRAKVGECRTGLKAGRADLKTAIAEARKVRAFLKSLKSSTAPTSSPS